MILKLLVVCLLCVQLVKVEDTPIAEENDGTEGPVHIDEGAESSSESAGEEEGEDHGPHWSYHGDYYPDRWQELHALCSSQSPRQSPIDIDPGQTVFEDDLHEISLSEKIDRRHTSMDITNNGHSVNIAVPHEAYIAGGDLPGVGYKVVGVHFHWGSSDNKGSEHTVDGSAFPLEMHMVSYDTERFAELGDAVMGYNSLAVLGTIFQISEEDNPVLTPIIKGLRRVRTAGSSSTISHFPLARLLPPNTNKYFRYLGSLTTPPCAESVVWTLFLHTQTISAKQMEQFRMLLSSEMSGADLPRQMVDNWRPVQPLYDRIVYRSFLLKSEMSQPAASEHDTGDHGNGASTVRSSVQLVSLSVLIMAAKML